MTAVFLFGAGASYGSGDCKPHPPPLGPGLFPALVKQGGLAARLPAALTARFAENFEAGMIQLMDDHYELAMQFQREIAGYLIQFTPGPDNAYVHLLNKVKGRRVTFSTINYDVLLEVAACHCGMPVRYAPEAPPGVLACLKLHGSSNFWPQLAVQLQGIRFLDKPRGDFDIRAPIRPVDADQAFRLSKSQDSLAPAMSFFAPGKEVRISPDFVRAQQEGWRAKLDVAEHVFIFGTRVLLEDTHIWEPIARSAGEIVYFGLEGDRDSFDEWTKTRSPRDAVFKQAYFAEAVASF